MALNPITTRLISRSPVTTDKDAINALIIGLLIWVRVDRGLQYLSIAGEKSDANDFVMS